jgi:AmiR/NasT family two-component response regulator
LGALNEQDLTLRQAVADVASVALIQDKISADTAVVNAQLQTALTSRVVSEQAKGVLAQTRGLDMVEAFAVLRGYARVRNLRLTEVAAAVVSRTMAAQALLDYAHRGRVSRT